MRKKLEGNGLWESSRMMLPEHKVAINEHEKTLRQRQRVELDEQELENIVRSVTESLQQRQQITLRLFHPIEELTVIGIVDRIDQLRGRLMVDGEWFPIQDIEGTISNE
ncbi:ATP-dependent helicase/DNAse subunit B [Paenibacillus endophyticus]|uniref:ATP-dependent helicase/DNAse subunit B n=1 Tax=Paenibacillus endophyticus TaxID=1294268 RepID=A0A7W5C6P2_9BACL|nr:YolD-like family protein [Paenibacillus endophyticus]MBB3152191.1 ATP-dependent helicase/DNAse subunit B [Paenibacillus endophyticus]